MISINNETMVKSSSAFGMPAYGCLAPTAALAVSVIPVTQVSTCVRTRHLAVMGADMGIALKGAFPGNRAWRPPSC